MTIATSAIVETWDWGLAGGQASWHRTSRQNAAADFPTATGYVLAPGPNSVPATLQPWVGNIHLGSRYPEPARLRGPDASNVGVPYLALLPGRFSVPRQLLIGRWALTPPFHPYPDLSAEAVFSLWHYLSRWLTRIVPVVRPIVVG
jgi:hypothetical protein